MYVLTKRSKLAKLLMGNDLRRLRNNRRAIDAVHDQRSFDELFQLLFEQDRSIVMRAVDAVEKITVRDPEYLKPHRAQLLKLLTRADHKELKWHIVRCLTKPNFLFFDTIYSITPILYHFTNLPPGIKDLKRRFRN